MEAVLITVIVCLLVLLIAIVRRYRLLLSELRSFARQVEKRIDDEYNRPVRVNVFHSDIAELAVKLNEHTDAKRKLSIEYKRSREQLNNIVSGISHDFRTPLTASLGYLQMIEKSGLLEGKNEEYLSIAINKNEYLKELSDEFFELSKLENGQEEVTVENLNLSNMLSDALMEQYGWMQERGITPVLSISDGIVIEGNTVYLARIIQNLFSNAEKYAVRRMGVTLAETDKGVELSVFNDTDDETDIDADRVFDPFYKPASRKKGGSGLGLYVVKCLCEKLGACVTADIDIEGRFSIAIIFPLNS